MSRLLLPFALGALVLAANPALSAKALPAKALPAKDSKSKSGGPPQGNLDIPKDVSEKSRKLLQEAKDLYHAAFDSTKKRDKLFKKALKKLRDAARDPEGKNTAVAHFYLGSAYNQVMNFPEAQPCLETAVKLNRHFHQGEVLLAEVYSKLGESKNALKAYDRALRVYPGYRRALKGKTETLVRLGEYKKARKAAEQALKSLKDPRKDPGPYLMSIIAQLRYGNKGPGWKKTYKAETANYIVVTELNQEFADEIARKVELIRRAYLKVFPNIRRSERKYEIWAYKSKSSYHRGGGPPMAAGHYSPLFRRLVIFRHPKEKDTTLVLYHEAFHQFLHEYLQLAPQWVNEGLGDYFGPFEYVRRGKKELMRSHPNPWRLRTVQDAIRRRILPAPAELMQMSREEMYDPRMAGYHYAQAWSLIYFMIEGKTYFKVLVKYFNELLKGRGIDVAYESSFARIDMDKFEAAWKNYILSKVGR